MADTATVAAPNTGGAAPSVAPVTPEANALKLAAETGQPVEVVERTTETTQVMANPNGRFTLRSDARPVRVLKDGAWRGIDNTLTTGADGLVRPIASTLDVAFGAGGMAPAVTVADAGRKVEFSWPLPLPKPTLNGNRATYAEILPGVDLALTAHADSFSQVLVVKSAKAAANPALRAIGMSAATTGVNLVGDQSGALSAKDGNGNLVFAGSTPVMWDSSHDPGTDAPDASASRGGKVSKVVVTATLRSTGGALSDVVISPDPAKLTGAGVVYPIFIDPSLSRTKWQWIQVTTAGWTHYNTNDQAGVGYCSGWPDCGGSWRSRSFFTINVAELNTRNGLEPVVFSAKFYIIQAHGAHLCTAEPVDLYVTGPFNSGTQWPGPGGSWVDQKSSGAGDQCSGGASIEFNAMGAVAAGINNNPNSTDLAFGLVSPNENNNLMWKRFDNNPSLVVEYSYAPNAPTDFWVNNVVGCEGKAVTADSRPVISATATDNNNPPLDIDLWMDVVNSAGTQVASMSPGPVTIASGTRGYWTVPPSLPDGDYGMRGAAVNRYPGDGSRNLASPLVGPYPFSIHAAKPAKPSIASTAYPKDYWGATQHGPGTMTVSSAGSVGVAYSIDGVGYTTPQPSDCNYSKQFSAQSGWAPVRNGSATFQLAPTLSVGYHTLRVKSFTDAHVLSDESDQHVFYIAPDAGLDTQRREAESLAPAQPVGQNISIATQGNCCSINWSNGSQLRFGGTAVNQSFTLDIPVSATGDYDLGVTATRSIDYATVAFSLDGQPIGPASTDLFNYTVMTEHVPLGTHRLTAGMHKLTIKTIGTNPKTTLTRYVVGVDEVVLNPVDRREAEQTEWITRTGPVSVESGATWSRGAQLRYIGSQSQSTFSLTFTVGDEPDKEADYALALGLTKAAGYGSLSIELDGKQLLVGTSEKPLVTNNPTTIVTHQPLGGAHLTPGKHVLSFEVKDSYKAGIDYLSVTRLNNAVENSFTEALNNNGVTSAGSTGSLDIINKSLPAEGLAAAGFTSGGTVTVNGAKFTLPDWNAPNDNVIATGQTIPIPGGVKAKSVGLLVNATCGLTPTAQTKISYTETSGTPAADQFTTPDMPEIGDWISGTDRDAAVVLPYGYEGTAVNNGLRGRIYAVFLPANPAMTLKSITLPRYGYMGYKPGEYCQPSLHVFGIAPVPVSPASWVGAWGAPADAAAPAPVQNKFANQTLRTVIHPNVAGSSVRVRLANPFVGTPVTIDAGTIGARAGVSDVTAPVALRFGGATSVTIPADGEVTSDPVGWPSGATDLVVSIHLPNAAALVPHHVSNTAVTLVANGNQTTTPSLSSPTTVSGTYFIRAVDVQRDAPADDAMGTVVVLGDQNSAIAPSANGTWAERLTGKLTATQGLTNAGRVGHVAGHWKLDRGPAVDYAGTANLTASGTVTYPTDGTRGPVASFPGTSLLAAPSAAVNTQGSYTVSAWAKLASTSTYYTVAAQGGVNAAAFYLQYNKNLNAWAFISPSSDSAAPSSYPAATGGAPALNTWTHLVGTYDAGAKTMTLYINGSQTGTVTNTTPFTTSGPFTVGGVQLVGGQKSNQFNGSVSNVWAFNRAVTADEARQLSQDKPALLTGSTATDALKDLNRTTFSNPNVRSVVVSLGANDLLDDSRTDPNAIKDSIRQRLIALTLNDPQSITNRTRGNGALVQMYVTTIAPLGLSSSDPREQARKAINENLRLYTSDYHAAQLVDVAAAVQDPVNNNLVQASLLTNGKPNDAYHNAVATAFNSVPGPI